MATNQNNQLTEQQFLTSYPANRQGRFYAMRLFRAMFQDGAFAEMSKTGDGKNAAILVMYIASQEDRFHYRPVKFWNDDISDALGFSLSPKTLTNAKTFARQNGWLRYWAAGKRAETYYYTLNPLDDESITSPAGSNEALITSGITSGITSRAGTPPNLLPNLLPNPEDKPNSKPNSACGYTTDFEEFWKAYPSIRKSGKKQAFEAWRKALKETAHTQCPDTDGWASYLIRRASDYAKSPTGNGQFAKGPTPWLNQGCWDDPEEAWNDSGDRGRGFKPLSGVHPSMKSFKEGSI